MDHQELSNYSLKDIRLKLNNYPDSLKDNFEISINSFSEIFSEQETLVWSLIGLKIAEVTTRSWESSLEFYRSTPDIIKYLPFNYIIQWGESGLDLSRQSPALATSYLIDPSAFHKSISSLGVLYGRSAFAGSDAHLF